MFKNIKCPKCGKTTKEKNSFCPSCGTNLKKNSQKDYGLLGQDDFPEAPKKLNEIQLPAGLGIIFNSLMKNLDKQLRAMNEEFEESPSTKPKKRGISISISTGIPKEFNPKSQIPEATNKVAHSFSIEKQKQIRNLKKLEPKTEIRRLSDRLIYDLEMPGVKTLEDVSITNLENSIEIKAIAKKEYYYKIIEINFPIIDYSLNNEILTLELSTRG